MLSMGVQANKLTISTNEADSDEAEAMNDSQARLVSCFAATVAFQLQSFCAMHIPT